MIARILAALVLLGFAVNAFWSNALGTGYSTGIVLLFLAAIVWFAWDMMREGWVARRTTKKGGAPIMQWDAVMDMKGMFSTFRPRRPRHQNSEEPR